MQFLMVFLFFVADFLGNYDGITPAPADSHLWTRPESDAAPA
jgi:hypothetical protein